MQLFCQFNKFCFFVIIISLFSCTSQKKMIYLQGIKQSDSLFKNTYINESYRVQPGDVIFIRISSLNKEINDLFNTTDVISNANINEAALYYRGYLINNDGTIDMPVLGKIEVVNKTLDEIQQLVQQRTLEYFKEVYVTVKYGGFKVTILGEVKRPGVYYFYNNKISILEALGESGDLTEYGNRQNVLLLRSSTNGLSTYRINLLDKGIIEKNYFYVQPNDIIYIEPVKTKAWRMNSANVSIILSSITTLILVINFVLKL